MGKRSQRAPTWRTGIPTYRGPYAFGILASFLARANSNRPKCLYNNPPATLRGRHNLTFPEIYYDTAQSESDNRSSKAFAYDMLPAKDFENVSTRSFCFIVNDIPTDKTGRVSNASTKEETVSSPLNDEKHSLNEHLDTVRSGESLIKHFNFDTSKYNEDTDKCIAFWRMIAKTGIQPVKCTLIKASKDSNEEMEEETEKVKNEFNKFMWYKALVELQRRKMDEVAFAATSISCQFCNREEPYDNFKRRQNQLFSENELKDTEDITCLNNWNPVKTEKKPTPVSNDSKSAEEGKALNLFAQHDKKQQLKIIKTPPPAPPPAPPPSIINLHSSLEEPNYNDKSIDVDGYDKCATSQDCDCRKVTCCCNKIWTQAPHDDGIVYLSSEVSEHNNMASATLELPTEPIKTESNAKKTALKAYTSKCVCGEADCECDEIHDTQLPEKTILSNSKIRWDRWEHKLEMSKRFIDDLQFKKHYEEGKQNKSCQQEIETEVKEPKRYCVICGHNDCECQGPQQQTRHKYFQHIEFDDDVIKLLFEQKENLAKKMGSQQLIAKKSELTQKQSHDEHVCNKSYDSIDTIKNAVVLQKNNVANKTKKLFVTPEQRVKQIVNKNIHILEIDKYGVPQVVRYADGKLGPKRVTSDDIVPSCMEDIEDAK